MSANQTKPAAAATPKAPQPKISLGVRRVPTWVPVVTTPDGRDLKCSHDRYGHESEKAARSCINRMINLDRAANPDSWAAKDAAAAS